MFAEIRRSEAWERLPQARDGRSVPGLGVLFAVVPLVREPDCVSPDEGPTGKELAHDGQRHDAILGYGAQ